jgi:hypothetical protein
VVQLSAAGSHAYARTDEGRWGGVDWEQFQMQCSLPLVNNEDVLMEANCMHQLVILAAASLQQLQAASLLRR